MTNHQKQKNFLKYSMPDHNNPSKLCKEEVSDETYLYEFLDSHDWNLAEIEEFLLGNSQDINTADDYDRTPLLIVLRDDRFSIDLVKLLIRFGADVNYKSNRGDTLLHTALRFHRGNEDIIRVLLEADVDVNALGKWNDSITCAALRWGAPKNIINLLLEAGVPQDACMDHGSVMHCAASFVLKEDIVNLLIKSGADVNKLDNRGQSPMCLALQGRRDIKMLLKVGGSFSACRHSSPFFCALEVSTNTLFTADLVELLLSVGASTKGVDEYGHSTLQLAVLHKKYETEAIRLLFDAHHADINAVWHDDNTLLHLAMLNEHYTMGVVKFLVKRGAKPGRVNALGQTALHIAANNCNCQPSLVNFLVKNGADVNARDKQGRTPLRIAVRAQKRPGVIQSMLTAGALIGDEDGGVDWLIRRVLRTLPRKHAVPHCKVLLKYYVLENSAYGTLRGYVDYGCLQQPLMLAIVASAVTNFTAVCVRELQEMESKSVGQGRSLFEFLSSSVPQINIAKFDPENYEVLNQFLRDLPENSYPVYFDVIATRFRRSSLITKLEEFQLYTINHCPVSTRIQNKVIMNYQTACEISDYLPNVDFLKLLLSFYKAVNHAQIICGKKLNVGGKRSPRRSATFPKRPKLN